MKTLLLILILTFSFSAFGQTAEDKTAKNYVQLAVGDNGPTSELLPMPVAMSRELTDAKIGIFYFGPQSRSDLSFLLLLKTARDRYSSGERFGVKLFADDLSLSADNFRLLTFVKNQDGEDVLRFHLKKEEIARMAKAETVRIKTYNLEDETEYDTLTLTPSGMAQFKKFAQTVFLILNAQ